MDQQNVPRGLELALARRATTFGRYRLAAFPYRPSGEEDHVCDVTQDHVCDVGITYVM